MNTESLLPHLFRTEYSRITAVLSKHFGIESLEMVEDITSDTFLAALETWPHKGIPENPKAWLYAVAKNKVKNVLEKNKTREKYAINILNFPELSTEIDLSEENIEDSQIRMIFAICNPVLPVEAQIGLALRILCGFGIEEIATAFLSNKETISKRLYRAKEKLKKEKIKIELPPESQIIGRLDNVLITLYLLFNEGYYSESQENTLNEDLCHEAMTLTLCLLKNPSTNLPEVNALFALMCFHASRFKARISQNGEFILYEDQDISLWNQDLINKGMYHLHKSSVGQKASKYHLEASLAYWMTVKSDEKWNTVLQLYNQLLILEYSPIAALNRTFAFSKVYGNEKAIEEAQKIKLENSPYYFSLLAELYLPLQPKIALESLEISLKLCKSNTEKALISQKINKLKGQL
ncbi:sigma-70 family RNA polymerase sigma factor [Lacihabitans sp. LS3-19]|uniref:RNA polymerase sigma factor n=1 Tax=Lacihabitans sp. LS3-19 TaxID=2487335 RepID=UPI0020CC472A|nr:sigma-70 family RNA polymerase sigma factor [Lacihabitans sp. LS3-19]MCP9767107.1 sigma-70 family RNA polymerase sigma factor [Lacihabitans sp. LS3-19]